MEFFNLFIVFGYLFMINTDIGQAEEIESTTPGRENLSDIFAELKTPGVIIIDDPTTDPVSFVSIEIASISPPTPTEGDVTTISPETAPHLAVLPLIEHTTAMPEFRKPLLSIDSTIVEETTVLSAAIEIRSIKPEISEETTGIVTLLEENTSIPTVRLRMLPISLEITELTTAAPENIEDISEKIQQTTTPDSRLGMIPIPVENTDQTTVIPESGEPVTFKSVPLDGTGKPPIKLNESSIILRILGSIPENTESTTMAPVPVEIMTPTPEGCGGAMIPSGGPEENTTIHPGSPDDAIPNCTGGATREIVEAVTGIPEVRETTIVPEIIPISENVEGNTTQHPGIATSDVPVSLNSTEVPVVSIGSGQSIPIELPAGSEDIFTDFPTAETDSETIS